MIRTIVRNIMVGDIIPNIVLPIIETSSVQTVNLLDITKDKTTLLIGHPGAFTNFTTKEMIPDYEEAGFPYQVIFFSVNDPFVMKKYAEKYKIKFPMLCDFNGVLTRTFEIGLPEDEYFSFCSKRILCVIKNTVILGVGLENSVQYTKITKPSAAKHLLQVINS